MERLAMENVALIGTEYFFGRLSNTYVRFMKAKHLFSFLLTLLSAHVGRAISWDFVSPYPTGQNLNSVAYGAGAFAAVGDGVTLYSTDNGANWPHGAGYVNTDKYVGVAYGNNKFVAVSAGSAVLTSSDGKTWTRTSPAGNPGSTDLAFGNGVFVAPSFNGKVGSSTNGTDWTYTTLGFSQAGVNIAFGNGKFIMANPGRVSLASSADGVSWTEYIPSLPRSGFGYYDGLIDIVFGNGVFVLSAHHNLFGADTFVSVDGASFERRSAPGSVIPLADGFYSYGAWSPDLVTWITLPFQLGLIAGASGGGFDVLVGGYGIVLRGPNLANLERIDSPDKSAYPVGVAASGSTIVAAHRTTWEPARLLVSTNNGRIFQPFPLPDTAGSPSAIAYADGRFVAVGAEGTVIRSTDGLTWSKRLSNTSSDLHHLAYGGGQWVAVGANGKIISSTDASLFTLRSSGTEVRLNAITFGAGKFVVVGQNGIILSSPNAIDWSMTGTDEAIDLHSVAYGNGRFVATGTNGLVHTWLDGGARQTTTIPGANLLSLAFYRGQFVAANVYTSQVFTSSDGLTWQANSSVPYGNLLGVNVSDNQLWAYGMGSLIWKAAAPTLSLEASIIAGKFRANISVAESGTYRIYRASDPASANWQPRDLLTITDTAQWVDNDPLQSAAFYMIKREP
jgi:hypothetical protein